MPTTPERVRAIASHLGALSDPQLQLFIDDAMIEIASFPAEKIAGYEERLPRYLAAHLASMNVRRSISQQVGDMKVTYDSGTGAKGEGLASTPYGQEYLRLLDLLDLKPPETGPGLGLMVL